MHIDLHACGRSHAPGCKYCLTVANMWSVSARYFYTGHSSFSTAERTSRRRQSTSTHHNEDDQRMEGNGRHNNRDHLIGPARGQHRHGSKLPSHASTPKFETQQPPQPASQRDGTTSGLRPIAKRAQCFVKNTTSCALRRPLMDLQAHLQKRDDVSGAPRCVC